MERDVEEENKHRKKKVIVTNPDWLDLPEPIATNIILEHLDIVDYIRFSAVCKKWYSVQKEHRIRYSPYPPPLLRSFPWLSCIHCWRDYDEPFVFHLPDKQKTYKISLFKTSKRCHGIYYGHGWFLLILDQSLCILNPITGVQIELPPFCIPIPELVNLIRGTYISSPPTDPDCTILIINFKGKAYLCRPNDNSGWKTIEYNGYTYKTIFCHNKIYSMKDLEIVCMIDTLLPYPVEETFAMDCSEIPLSLRLCLFRLVDFFGELVVIIISHEYHVSYDIIKEFHVYKADFSTNKWVRMESLGEYALFYSLVSTFPLPADDVGCKKNIIYSAEGFVGRRASRRAFDLSIRDWIDVPSMSLSCDNHSSGKLYYWFLPTLD